MSASMYKIYRLDVAQLSHPFRPTSTESPVLRKVRAVIL
ncbi:hypothetical protein BN903_9 [Halorubrum sp. AJ67]|nr:hypothetical protein BN903_9 [Halorubrum sp. AJ67]